MGRRKKKKNTETKTLVTKAERKKGTVPRYCAYITKTGRQCRQVAKRTSRYCALHDPKNMAAVERGRRTGGSVMKHPKVEDIELEEVKDLEGCVKQLNQIQGLILKERLPGPIASALVKITESISNVLKLIVERDKDPEMRRLRELKEMGPLKMYGYFDEREYNVKVKKFLSHPEGVEALDILSRIEAGEPVKSKAIIRGKEKSGSPLNLESQNEAESAENGSSGRKKRKKKKEPPAEETLTKDEDEPQKPTVAFTNTEEFWEQLTMKQNPGYELD